jgi:hypothetical protein
VITTPARSTPPWLAIIGFLIGMAGIAAAITVAFMGMRSVLDVGGQCASGGPYVIAVQCPDGTWTLPLAIFGGLGFAFLAVAGGSKVGGIYGLLPGLAWVGLFCGLGFNFLQWGIAPPVDPADQAGGPGLIFVLLGIMFEVMGIAPVVTTLWSRRPGAPKPSVTFGGKSYDTAGLIQSAEAFRDTASTPAGSMFQTAGGPQQVDLKELMSEVAATVAEARAKGIIGPMVMTPGGLTGLTGLTGAGSPAAEAGGSDLVAELERLTKLHQAGNLTDEEFAAAKQNLIKGNP